MSSRIELSGFAELRAALMRLPRELGGEAGDLIENTTEETASSLTQAYPLGDTGHLRAGVKATVTRDQFGAFGVVSSTARHAYLYEFGTAVRHTRLGWNRGWAPSHKPDGLIPIAIRARQRLTQRLIALVERAGLQVS